MACWWLDGDDLWARREESALDSSLARDLADTVTAIRGLRDLPLPVRRAGQRGGPLGAVLDQATTWLDEPRWNAASLVDIDRVRRIIELGREREEDEYVPVPLHGDLLPGNLLVDTDGRLTAIIDWSGAGLGDPAEDLAPAWSIFDEPARSAFRSALDVHDHTWDRARAIELEHALGGMLYYRPRRHPLGDVMARTLHRILDDER